MSQGGPHRAPRIRERGRAPSSNPYLSGPLGTAQVRFQALVPEPHELLQKGTEHPSKFVEEWEHNPRGNPRNILDPHPQRILPVRSPATKSEAESEVVGLQGLG